MQPTRELTADLRRSSPRSARAKNQAVSIDTQLRGRVTAGISRHAPKEEQVRNSGIRHCLRRMVAIEVLLIFFLGLVACTTTYPGYPRQALISFEPPFEREDLETHVGPASPGEVAGLFGQEFASLPRLGVVLVLVKNKRRAEPIVVSRQTVRLTLPDGRVLKALGPSEIMSWFKEVYGSMLEKSPKNVIFGRYSNAEYETYEKGVLTISEGEARGAAMVFRFPEKVAPGRFTVEYVLDLGKDGQVPVKQTVDLNMRP
jgi:hypothetical protein